VAAEATVCPHCERETEAVRGTCPNCGQAKDGEASVFEHTETRSSARGELEDWLLMAVWFVPGLAVLLIGLVLVESMALVAVGAAVLLAPAVIWFLFEGSDGSWW
jgi:hypothetical protein